MKQAFLDILGCIYIVIALFGIVAVCFAAAIAVYWLVLHWLRLVL